MGRSRADLLGKSHWAEYPATLGTETERSYRRAVAEGVAVAFEFFYPPHDRWYEVHAYPSADGLSVYFRDATERRRAADALRESEGRLRLLADAIPQLAWTARADGHIVWYNRRWYEYTGTTPQEMEGWGWQAVHDPVALPAVLERWTSSIATGEPFDMVFPLRGADGRFRPFLTRVSPQRDGDGRVLSWFGTNTDVGALKEAEDRLRESEVRFRQLADAMPQIVWMAGPDGRIDYLNRRWHEFTGLPGDAGDDGWAAIVHPDDMPAAAGRWAESLRSGAAFDTELRLLDRRDGSYRWHLLRTVPVWGAGGAVARWYGTATDIDAQKRAADAGRFLAEASAALAGVVDYESTLQRVAGLAVPHFADWAAVDVTGGTGGPLRRLAVAHREPAKVRLAQELHDRYPPDPDAPNGAAAVLRTGRAEMVGDITDEMLVRGARDADHLALVRGLGLRSYICVPLVVAGTPLGVLTFVTAESGRRYTDADLALAEDLARRAAVAVENVRLYQELREADARRTSSWRLLGHELRNPRADQERGADSGNEGRRPGGGGAGAGDDRPAGGADDAAGRGTAGRLAGRAGQGASDRRAARPGSAGADHGGGPPGRGGGHRAGRRGGRPGGPGVGAGRPGPADAGGLQPVGQRGQVHPGRRAGDRVARRRGRRGGAGGVRHRDRHWPGAPADAVPGVPPGGRGPGPDEGRAGAGPGRREGAGRTARRAGRGRQRGAGPRRDVYR